MSDHPIPLLTCCVAGDTIQASDHHPMSGCDGLIVHGLLLKDDPLQGCFRRPICSLEQIPEDLISRLRARFVEIECVDFKYLLRTLFSRARFPKKFVRQPDLESDLRSLEPDLKSGVRSSQPD